jgi:poly(A) polymerase
MAMTSSEHQAGLKAASAELEALLLAPDMRVQLEKLHRLGRLERVLPEVAALVGFHEGVEGVHKDLWDHTLRVVEQMPARADLRWSALLHDVGKVPTRELLGGRKVTFWRHEQAGAVLSRKVGRRLGWSAERIERVAFIVENHGRFNAYEECWTDKAVRRLIRDAGPYLEDLLTFSAGDLTTRNAKKERRAKRENASLRLRVAQLLEDRPRLPSDLGDALMAAFDLEAGPEVGKAMGFLEAAMRSGQLPSVLDRTGCVTALRQAIKGGELEV